MPNNEFVIKRLLILIGALAFSLSLSGGAQTLHHLFDHAGAGLGSCAEKQTCESPEQTPVDDEPAPEPEDNCPVCHTLTSTQQSFTTPDVFEVIESSTVSVDAPPCRVVPAPQHRWSTGPARAPPVTV